MWNGGKGAEKERRNLLDAATFVEMLAPVAFIQATDNNAAGGGGVGKESIFEVDADVGDTAFAVGEENHVALAQLAAGDEFGILLNVVGHAVEVAAIDLAIDVAYKT